MKDQVNTIQGWTSTRAKTSRGFTLIEVVVVMGIVAILAAIAIPSYIEQGYKTRRSDAKTGLMEIAQTLERCFTQFNVYNHANCPIQNGDVDGSPDGYYNITSTVTANTFSLTAARDGSGAQADDDRCTSFTLTQDGTTTAAGTLGNSCWD